MTCTLILFGFAGFLFALNADLRSRLPREEGASEHLGRYRIHPSYTCAGWTVSRTDTDFPVKWQPTKAAAIRWAQANPNPTLLLIGKR
jgi:hypothetical protein